MQTRLEVFVSDTGVGMANVETVSAPAALG
jgi:hypothetical protein